MAHERVVEGDDVARRGRVRRARRWPSMPAASERNLDPEMRALAFLAVEADAAAERFGQRLGDRGAEAGTAEAAPMARVGLLEGLEDPRLRFRGMPMPVSRTEKRSQSATPRSAIDA